MISWPEVGAHYVIGQTQAVGAQTVNLAKIEKCKNWWNNDWNWSVLVHEESAHYNFGSYFAFGGAQGV